jgi:glycosyltransferase involved in cell wall biosynthesis
VAYVDVDEIYKKIPAEKRAQTILKKYKLKENYIFAGGGLEIRKNITGVLQAYKILLEENKREKFLSAFPSLVIAGKLRPELSPLITDVYKIAKEMNLKKYVKLLDFVPQADLPALYQKALMFVYPSLYEGFGLPVLEAMNQGTPVVTAKKASLPEVGQDAVLYCNPEDIEELARVMKRVLLDEKLRKVLSERGRARAKKFSWENFTEKVLNIITVCKNF